MPSIKNISIPTPCHESWAEMAPVEQGRHCQSCCKTVMDFNTMSNAGVVAYLASHQNACGRISDNKIAAINYQLELEKDSKFPWKGLFAAASLSMLFTAAEAQSNHTHRSPFSNSVRSNGRHSAIPKLKLETRMTHRIGIAPVLVGDSVVDINLDERYRLPLIGPVGGIVVTYYPFYKRWWFTLKRLF